MSYPSIRGTREEARFPLALLGLLAPILVATLWDPPAGRTSWVLEVGPGIAGIVALAIAFPRFPVSRMVYVCTFLHILILVYGGYYTYANTPLGDWAKDAFGLARNHYDRVGHVALGFFPAFVIREAMLRATPLERGGWLVFIVLSVVLAIGAFWELLEWWTALIAAPEVGSAFLGTQGDEWDAQWDMFLALVGAGTSLLLLSGVHDRSLKRLFERCPPV